MSTLHKRLTSLEARSGQAVGTVEGGRDRLASMLQRIADRFPAIEAVGTSSSVPSRAQGEPAPDYLKRALEEVSA